MTAVASCQKERTPRGTAEVIGPTIPRHLCAAGKRRRCATSRGMRTLKASTFSNKKSERQAFMSATFSRNPGVRSARTAGRRTFWHEQTLPRCTRRHLARARKSEQNCKDGTEKRRIATRRRAAKTFTRGLCSVNVILLHLMWEI